MTPTNPFRRVASWMRSLSGSLGAKTYFISSKVPVSANRIAALWPASILFIAGLVLLAMHLHPVDLAMWFLVCLAGARAYRRLKPPDDEKEEVEADKVRSRLDEKETLQSWF